MKTTLRDEYKAFKCKGHGPVTKNEPQCRQRVHTRPIASQAQTSPQKTRYVLESGAHVDQSLGHSLGQYI